MTINLRDPNDSIGKTTLKEFIQIYWQGVCSSPKTDNPAWQNNGSKDGNFNNNINNNDLYMLNFSRDPQTALTREIQIPSNNQGLFIPILSVVVSACETNGNLVQIANKDQASINANSIELYLDGTAVSNSDLNKYKFNPNQIGQFQVNFPSLQDAIFDIDNQGPCNAVAAGFYVWTQPLSLGNYTVYFSGDIRCRPRQDCIDTHYYEEITYKITVS